jgi:UbiD family decarboxylase
MVISAITHRAGPIYQMMAAGSREDGLILGVGRAAELLRALEIAGTDVVAISLTPTILGAVVSIRQRYDGEAKSVALAALGVYRWLKYCVVVDDDIDVDDHEEILWAMTTRTNAQRDFIAIPGTFNFPSPFDTAGIHSTKLVIDATFPCDERSEFERTVPPGDEYLRIDDFI